MQCRSGADADPTQPPRCASQCSGHGECILGFCKCHEGWYGADCSRKRAGQPMEPGARSGIAACGLRLAATLAALPAVMPGCWAADAAGTQASGTAPG